VKVKFEIFKKVIMGKTIEIELNDEQQEYIAINEEKRIDELTANDVHHHYLEGGDDKWLNENLLNPEGWTEDDKDDWDGCVSEIIHDNGTKSEFKS
jgi:hypothetical protein